MAGYIGSRAVSVNTTSATLTDDLTIGDDLTVTDDMTVGGTLGVTGVLTATSLDISGDIDVDGTTNLDVVDIDGAVNMATTALVTGVLTTTAATVFNGGFAAGGVGTFADGSAGAPSITNTGDLNTGILFPAADTVGFSTGGTERMRITTDKVQFNVDAKVGTNDAHDLGANGARWKDLYLSGTADITGVLTTGDRVGVDTATEYDGTALTAALTVSGGSTSGSILQGFRTANSLFVLSMSAAGRSYFATTGAQSQIHLQTGTTVGSATTKMTIEANGDAMINDGNLVIGTSGHGIDFAATSGSGTSELFDDYEEGTWTPVLRGTGGVSGQSYSSATGTYTKVGRTLVASFSVVLADKGSMSGDCIVAGLPFTSISASTGGGVVGFINNTGVTITDVTINGAVGQAYAFLQYINQGTTYVNNLNILTDTTRVDGVITVQVA
jgi:cytoskeletal protein CcmA (bactofilin family)